MSLLVFLLGFRHGFDADHLAAIDGLTRFNSRMRPARFCGALFSLGHGAVVVFVSLMVGRLSGHWNAPQWLEAFGDWISVVFLTLLGILNLHAVMNARPGRMVRLVGLKERLLGRFFHAANPALVGALFALSFDTVSQAALFSWTASRSGGWQNALSMGLLFTLGMLFTDGVNGLWISRLLNRADRTALFASRAMGLAVAILSLLVAAFGTARLAFPVIANWSEGKETVFGLCAIGFVAASFFLAVRKGLKPALRDPG